MSISVLLKALLWSFGASACCCFYLNTSLRHIIWGGLLGAVGWGLYKIIFYYSSSLAISFIIGSFAVALLSEILASILRSPATVFLLPGLLPLVPGGGIFSMMRYAVMKQFDMALHTGYETTVEALSIALGIAVASSIGQIIKAVISKAKKH